MPTVTRLTSNGVFQSLGGFDEVSLNSGSIKFSGTDWLTLANTAALQIPTADFTVEMFVYCNTFVATGNGQILLGKGLVGTGTYEHNFILANSSGNMFLQFGYSTTGSNQIFLNSSTIPITLNSWNHLAYTRTGTNLTFWFNGVSYGTFTVPSTMFTSSGLISIASNATGAYNPLNGYISNLRFVNGTNLYTSNFTPPTSPLLPIANTALLLSVYPQNPFGDSSVNNLTVTKNGTPSFNTLGPFYFPANTSINLANTNNNPALGSNTNIITSTTSNGVVMVSNEFDEVSMSLSNTKQKVLNTGTMMVKEFDEWTGVPVVDSSLKLWIDAGQPASYPGSGTTWTDLSGNGKNGTLVSGVTYNSNNGGSIALDGSTGYILLGPIDGIGIATSSFTMGIWVYPTGVAGNIVSMSSTNPSGGWNEPPIRATGQQFQGHIYSNAYLTYNYNLNTWYYLTLVFNYAAGSQTFYVNGVSVGSTTGIVYSGSGVSNYLFLGQANPGVNNTGMFPGRISNFHIHNRALQTAEVQQNFNALRGRYGI